MKLQNSTDGTRVSQYVIRLLKSTRSSAGLRLRNSRKFAQKALLSVQKVLAEILKTVVTFGLFISL